MARSCQQLQPDGKRACPQWFAVDHSGSGAEIAWKGVYVQPLIELPGPGGNDAGPVHTHVLREAFMGPLPDIQAAEIHSYGEGNAIFHALRQSLHGTPLDLQE